MIHSRIYDHFQNVLRDDMLTIFSRVANLSSLEVSMVLDTMGILNSSPSDTKYKAACILELLTHQRPLVKSCNIKFEGVDSIFLKNASSSNIQRGRSNIHSSSSLRSHSSSSSSYNFMTTDDYRKAATTNSGLRLSCLLKNDTMFHFLEKLREFYLPDLMSMESQLEDVNNNNNNENDHGLDNFFFRSSNLLLNTYHEDWKKNRKNLAKLFQVWNKSKSSLTNSPSRLSLSLLDNPWESVATYYLKSSEILKFPDIEEHFESLSSILNDDPAFYIYIRPTIRVSKVSISGKYSLPERIEKEKIDRLGVMNCLLTNLFNPYMKRVSFPLKAPKAPPPKDHVGSVDDLSVSC